MTSTWCAAPATCIATSDGPTPGLLRRAPSRRRRSFAILDERGLSAREAERLTGVAHSEFSRIRNTQLRRFTLDRLIGILGKLDGEVEVSVTIRAGKPRARAARGRAAEGSSEGELFALIAMGDDPAVRQTYVDSAGADAWVRLRKNFVAFMPWIGVSASATWMFPLRRTALSLLG